MALDFPAARRDGVRDDAVGVAAAARDARPGRRRADPAGQPGADVGADRHAPPVDGLYDRQRDCGGGEFRLSQFEPADHRRRAVQPGGHIHLCLCLRRRRDCHRQLFEQPAGAALWRAAGVAERADRLHPVFRRAIGVGGERRDAGRVPDHRRA